jgi:uncharacterized membrane protein HdeD (DUF308 family)
MAAGSGPSRPAGMPGVEAIVEALHHGRRKLMIAGVLLIVLGIVAIVIPALASVATAIFIGWILVVAAAYQVVDAFSAPHWGRTALRLLLALVSFAAGFYLLVAPLQGTFTLTVMLVIWFVATGIARIVLGIAERGVPGAGWTVLNGVVTLLLGILIAEGLPSTADWAIGLIVGLDLLFSGMVLVAIAQQLKGVRPGETAPPVRPAPG